MFCKKCGAEMSEDARFCPKCGYDTLEGKGEVKTEKVEDNEVKCQLRPKFKLGYKLLTSVGRAILYIVFFGLVFLGEIEEADAFGYVFSSFLGIIILIIGICVIIKLIFEKIQYDHYEYNFYNSKVEYKDGFLNKEEKELKYKHIREVALKQNIIQRMFNIGTIRIFTNATSASYGRNNTRNFNGLQIHCIENPREQYENVKKLIDIETSED